MTPGELPFLSASPALVALGKRFEGLHHVVAWRPAVQVVPYVCPAGFWTIGYGHLCSKDHPAIDEAGAERYLAEDFRVAITGAIRQCPNLLAEPPGRLDAIADFCFNLGEGRLAASTLRKRVLAGAWEAAGEELRRWVWGGGRKLPGLILRREAERELLLRGEAGGEEP